MVTRSHFCHRLQEDNSFFVNLNFMMNYLKEGPLSAEQIFSAVKLNEKTDTGGHSVFLGQVRADRKDGKIVKAIEYSAYEGMVNKEADKIKELICSEFDDVRTIEIIHSTGTVKAGELSLFVLVSAGHRDQAIRACHQAVELIKEKLPVWKKEIFEDGTSGWRENS
jgi:molybdopterin synthase catalytic subunit